MCMIAAGNNNLLSGYTLWINGSRQICSFFFLSAQVWTSNSPYQNLSCSSWIKQTRVDKSYLGLEPLTEGQNHNCPFIPICLQLHPAKPKCERFRRTHTHTHTPPIREHKALKWSRKALDRHQRGGNSIFKIKTMLQCLSGIMGRRTFSRVFCSCLQWLITQKRKKTEPKQYDRVCLAPSQLLNSLMDLVLNRTNGGRPGQRRAADFCFPASWCTAAAANKGKWRKMPPLYTSSSSGEPG